MCKRYASLHGFQAPRTFFALRTIDSSANSCYGVYYYGQTYQANIKTSTAESCAVAWNSLFLLIRSVIQWCARKIKSFFLFRCLVGGIRVRFTHKIHCAHRIEPILDIQAKGITYTYNRVFVWNIFHMFEFNGKRHCVNVILWLLFVYTCLNLWMGYNFREGKSDQIFLYQQKRTIFNRIRCVRWIFLWFWFE